MSKKVSYAELERMLFELYECSNVTPADIEEIEGLDAWATAENAKRWHKRDALRKSALAKLTNDERAVLGFPVEEDFVDDSDEDDDEDY